MIAKNFGSRLLLIGSSLLVFFILGFSIQGCSGPVAKVNNAERKVEQAENRADNKVDHVEQRVDRAERRVDRITD